VELYMGGTFVLFLNVFFFFLNIYNCGCFDGLVEFLYYFIFGFDLRVGVWNSIWVQVM
jgi:hypothetical protein